MHCNNCNVVINVEGLLCTVCDDFKLCMKCFDACGHSHIMKRPNVEVPDAVATSSQLQATALGVEDLPFKRYVRVLFRAYRSQEGNDGATYKSLYAHTMATKLVCSCLFCKQMYFIFNYHTKKCRRTPKCRISRCPVINETLLKKRLAAMAAQALERKLLKGRLAARNVQDTTASDSSNTSDPAAASLLLARKFTIQRCIRTLVHACQCLDADCMPVSCHKMKRILAHIKICKRKISGGCTICRQLSTLCCYHAKTCKEVKCPVLLCSAIKRKLQQAKYMKKRCAI